MNLILHFFIFLISNHIIAESNIIQEISAQKFAQLYPNAQVLQCTQNYPFNFKKYPLYQEHAQTRFPHQGTFNNSYIISISNAIADFYEDSHWGVAGLIFINKYFIKEFQIKNISPFRYEKTNRITRNIDLFPIELNGSVAICWHPFAECYGHFILDVLCQLALLEIHNIQYDHLCIPYSHKFMHNLLNLWGIDEDKIISFTNNTKIIADTIIVPTAVTQIPQIIPYTNYTIDFLIEYVREKLLKNIKNKETATPKKIFISRKDSSLRNIPNEDEIFQEFENRGFQRYELSKLSIEDQILLFHNADEIVSFVGSGSTNIIFSKPGTKYIEIIQTMVDATFFFLADIMKLEYYFINNSTYNDFLYGNQNTKGKIFPINIIQDFLRENPQL